jgi:poly-gamma-glutamate capsule biosynthesis protein CapA/YwtB (metallophosphatase superfamily)
VKSQLVSMAAIVGCLCFLVGTATRADAPDEHKVLLEVAIGGDVALNWRGTPAYWKAFPQDLNPLLPLAGVFARSDFAFVNLEGVLMRSNPKVASKRWNLWAPAVSAQVFKPAGITVVGHANNHSFDGRSAGVLETHRHLKEAGVSVFGSGATKEEAEAPWIHRVGDDCLAVVPATTKMNLPRGRLAYAAYYPKRRMHDLVANVKLARDRCSMVIVSIHWGVQYAEQPEEWMRALGVRLLDAGALAVVGHHPHVLGAIEFVGDKPIVYSLGNLVFSNPDVKTRRTGVLELDISTSGKQRVAAARLVPVFIEKRPYNPRLMTEAEGQTLGERLDAISAPYNASVTFESGTLSLRPKTR